MLNFIYRGDKLDEYYRLASSTSEPEPEEDEDSQKEEKSQDETDDTFVDFARGKGPLAASSSSEDDVVASDYDSNPENDFDAKAEEATFSMNPLAIDAMDIPMGEPTRRIAVLHLDWDHIEAQDLFVLLSSFKPSPLSSILSVKVYISQFGKERMAKENLEGPPAHLFNKLESNLDEENTFDQSSCSETDSAGNSGTDSEITSHKPRASRKSGKSRKSHDAYFSSEDEDATSLQQRAYQLERLRYYYAIVTCDSVETARAIYEHCDGREFEKTCNFLDLRYVPEDEVFEEVDSVTGESLLKKVCTQEMSLQLMNGDEPYNGKDFTTAALQHTKVKITWDEDDPNRLKVTRAKFSKDRLDDMDFKAYLATSSSSDDEKQESFVKGTESVTLKDRIAKYKSLLLDTTSSNVFGREQDQDLDMQMTFEDGHKDLVGSNEESEIEIPEEETVFHANLRKRREKKKLGKAALKGTQASYLDESGKKNVGEKEVEKIVKYTRKRHIEPEDDQFNIDVKDKRFESVLEDSSYAIDPSHPLFTDSKGMRQVLHEKQKRIKRN